MLYTTLIGDSELETRRHGGAVTIIDCRFDLLNPDWGEARWREAHIPGALYAHLDRDLSAPRQRTSGRHPLPDRTRLAAQFGRWGITSDTQIVAYDQGNGMFAARLWWLARWLGHRAVAVLDGGFAAWCAGGRPIDNHPPRSIAAEFSAAAALVQAVSTRDVEAALVTGRAMLIDARAADRFRGENETIDPVAGHIPGAINLPFATNLTASGKFHSPQHLREGFDTRLGATGREIISMCGSGVTACHNLLALEHAGLGGGRLYAGSWSEWITDSRRAIATGP
ncbi:MAG: sulfurtransferase [Steroidobacteraceae bacterium]